MTRTLPVAITLLSILAWAALVLLSHAFLAFTQPVTGEGVRFLLLVLVKYYPLVAIGALVAGLLFSDTRGRIPLLASLLPPVTLGLVIALVFRNSAVDWDTYDGTKQQQLMRASAHGSARDIRQQIAAGMNPNMAGRNGNNPLYAAYQRDNMATFAALLDAGADPNALPRGNSQYNIAFAIIDDLDDDVARRRRYFAALLQHGLDVNLGDGFRHLIHAAASSNDAEYLRLLLERGADPNAQGSFSPLGAATLFAHYDKALMLLPVASPASMDEAAGMLEELRRQQRLSGDAAQREELSRQLQARGIDFAAAYARLVADRQRRLERDLSATPGAQ